MKRSSHTDEPARFSGSLRHYHRTGGQQKRSWDDWVDGVAAVEHRSKNWPKIVGIGIGILALGGIIAGLIVELG